MEHISQFVELDEIDKMLIRDILPIQQYEKGDLILKEGNISTSFYFNLSGFVRLFYTKDIEETTAYFYSEGTYISAYDSFINQVPSKMNFQAMEDTLLVAISSEAAFKLLQHSSKFELLARVAMEEEIAIYQKIIASLLTSSPEDRYFNLMKENPEVLQRVPQHYVASYIGVKPESLSRIKKRHLQQKS